MLDTKVVLLDTKQLMRLKKHEQWMIFSDLNPYRKKFENSDLVIKTDLVISISLEVHHKMSLACQYIKIPSKMKCEIHALFMLYSPKILCRRRSLVGKTFFLYKFVAVWFYFRKGFMSFVYLLLLVVRFVQFSGVLFTCCYFFLDLFSFLMFKTRHCGNLRQIDNNKWSCKFQRVGEQGGKEGNTLPFIFKGNMRLEL